MNRPANLFTVPLMRARFILLILFALVGVVASIWMTQSHFRLATTGLEEKSFCNISEFIDCDTALASRYSKVGTIPTSEFGILYYMMLVFGLFLSWASEAWRRATLSFLFAAAVFAIFYSGVMAYLSIVRLGVLCLLCLSTYIANLFILLILPGTLGVRWWRAPVYLLYYLKAIFGGGDLRPRIFAHLGFVVIFFGVGLLFFRGLHPEIQRAYAEVPKEIYLKGFENLPAKEAKIPSRPSWGRSDAKVTILEFSDFQCPFCRRAAFNLKPALGEYRKDVRFVFLNYPLDNACNPAIPHAMHPVSCIAAKGGVCADQMGKFWEYHDEVFENQKKLSRDTILEIAKKVGLDAEKFNQCLASDEVGQRVKEDIDLGNQFGVQGTPAVFINGRPFRDWPSPERLRMIMEWTLGR